MAGDSEVLGGEDGEVTAATFFSSKGAGVAAASTAGMDLGGVGFGRISVLLGLEVVAVVGEVFPVRVVETACEIVSLGGAGGGTDTAAFAGFGLASADPRGIGGVVEAVEAGGINTTAFGGGGAALGVEVTATLAGTVGG